MSREALARYYYRESQILMGDCGTWRNCGDHATAEIFWNAAKVYAQLGRTVDRRDLVLGDMLKIDSYVADIVRVFP